MSITLFSETTGWGKLEYQIDLGLYPDNTPVVDLEEAWNGAAGKFKAILVRPNINFESAAEELKALTALD